MEKNPAIDLALDTINLGKQAIIFVNTKRSAEKTAEDISKKIRGIDLQEISDKSLHALTKPTKQCERLSICLRKGIAFHHAGLVAKQRELIEENFKKGAIKIICATTTLAYGLNLPAFRSIVKDPKRYGHRGLDYLPVLEIHQMWGRAGRPGFDRFGEAIIIAQSENEKEELLERYINGKPENIYSKLAVEPVLRTYILSLIASGFVNTKQQLFDFFSKTFWAHQFGDMYELNQMLQKMIGLLHEWEFIMGNKDEFQGADELGDERYRPTIIGKRVAELYIDPLTAKKFIDCIKKAASKETNVFSFVQMISHTLELRPLLKVKAKEYDKVQEVLTKNFTFLLEEEPNIYDQDYDDFLNSIKLAMFFQEWLDEKDEEYLLETYDIRPGEIKVKLDIADWLLYTSEEMARLMQFQPLLKDIAKLRVRLKSGVREELIPLLNLRNIGRVRARKLFNNRIKDLGDVKSADITKLSQILGKNIAIGIKEQVGEKVEPVKENKRKGQI